VAEAEARKLRRESVETGVAALNRLQEKF